MPQRSAEHVASFDNPVACPHVDNANPHKDTGGESIEGPQRDERLAILPVEGVDHTHANRHTDGRDEREDTAHDRFARERTAWQKRDPGS